MRTIPFFLSGLFLLSPGAERLRVSLSETICAMPEVECNIYFDSVINVINPASDFFEVNAPKGRSDVKRWHSTSGEKESGESDFRLNVYDDTGLAGSGVTKTVVATKTSEKERTILLIGSTEPAAGIHPMRILDLREKSGFTPGYAPNIVTEGYPAWARSGRSPFLLDGGTDFSRHITEKCAGHTPDVVTVTFSGNDAFGMNTIRQNGNLPQFSTAMQKSWKSNRKIKMQRKDDAV